MERRVAGSSAISLCAALVACSASEDSARNGPFDPNDPNGSSDPNAPFGGGLNGGGSGDQPGGGLTVGDGPVGMDDCGGDIYRGESSILDMHIMMDRSGSMGPDEALNIPFVGMIGGGGVDKWSAVGTALGDFVVDPASTGISAGIQFFPLPMGSDEPQTCGFDYATPAQAIGPLPQNGAAIQGAIINNGPPSGGTPTVPAMQGAVAYATQWAQQNPSHNTIIVLATDGEPNDCNSDVPQVASIAAAAFSSPERIDTYVIGIGNVAGLNEIAQAGGSGQALIVSADPTLAAQEFLTAMNAIRNRAIPCDFSIPIEGRSTPDLVNVQVTPPTGSMTVVPRVDGPDLCGAGGWYYDNNGAPNRISACPSTCDMIMQTDNVEISIVVGCRQVVQ